MKIPASKDIPKRSSLCNFSFISTKYFIFCMIHCIMTFSLKAKIHKRIYLLFSLKVSRCIPEESLTEHSSHWEAYPANFSMVQKPSNDRCESSPETRKLVLQIGAECLPGIPCNCQPRYHSIFTPDRPVTVTGPVI